MKNVISDIKAIEPWGQPHLRSIDAIKHIVIHRNTKGKTGTELAQWLHDEGYEWTGSKRMSYHFLIRKDGVVEQCLPLEVNGPAARGMNATGIQICVVGNFAKHKPKKVQWEALITLCAQLKRAFPKATILPHNPKKPCPGKFLSVNALNMEVLDRLEETGRNAMKVKGVIFNG